MVKTGRFPIWFRAFVAAMFATLLIAYALVRDGRSAMARSPFGGFGGSAAPLLNVDAALSRKPDMPTKGEYRLNGMLVRYRSLWTPASPKVAIRKFVEAANKAGYKTKGFQVQGQPAATGIHPKSKVMISMIVLKQHMGLTQVRLAQQNLSELDKNFEAEIPGIPVYAGASNRALVTPVSGSGTQSLTYSTTAAPAWLKSFYVSRLREQGWSQMKPPAELPDLPVLFFSKDHSECSVVLMRAGELGQTIVLVTLTQGVPS